MWPAIAPDAALLFNHETAEIAVRTMMPLHPVSRKDTGRSGFVLLTSAVSMIVVIGFLGLAMDVGYLQVMRMRAQVAADAGALAAGHEILNGNTSQITTSACNDASLNGFTTA